MTIRKAETDASESNPIILCQDRNDSGSVPRRSELGRSRQFTRDINRTLSGRVSWL